MMNMQHSESNNNIINIFNINLNPIMNEFQEFDSNENDVDFI